MNYITDLNEAIRRTEALMKLYRSQPVEELLAIVLCLGLHIKDVENKMKAKGEVV